jgi:hypothetical protein
MALRLQKQHPLQQWWLLSLTSPAAAVVLPMTPSQHRCVCVSIGRVAATAELSAPSALPLLLCHFPHSHHCPPCKTLTHMSCHIASLHLHAACGYYPCCAGGAAWRRRPLDSGLEQR